MSNTGDGSQALTPDSQDQTKKIKAQRRPHTKTRHGCSTCKARKVRCDEEKPICRNCTRGNRACRYPDQVLALPNALGPAQLDGQDQIFPVRDMELLHHYTAISYRTMTDSPDKHHVWQVFVPKLAFAWPFLLHGILSATALHRRYENPEQARSDALLHLARYHQQHALTLYIPLLQAIDEKNCHALFAFSIVLAVICFGMLHENNHDNEQSLVSRFIDVFDALAGAQVVAIEATDWLRRGELSVIMDELEPEVRDLSVLDTPMRLALETLIDLAQRTCNGEDPTKAGLDKHMRMNAYENSIYGLVTVLSPSVYRNRPLSVVISWSILAGNGYISLLRQCDPIALLVLGHYGVALHRLEHLELWVLSGLGRRLTDAVLADLDSSWHSYLTLAKALVSQTHTPQQAT